MCMQVCAFVTWPMIQLVSLAKYKLSVDLLSVSFNITLSREQDVCFNKTLRLKVLSLAPR